MILKLMPLPASSPAAHAFPAQAGKTKPSLLQDIGWGRPVFRAPELPSPRIAFDPLPLPSHFSGGRYLTAGR